MANGQWIVLYCQIIDSNIVAYYTIIIAIIANKFSA